MRYLVYLHSGPQTDLEEVVTVEAETVDIKDKLTSLYSAYPKKLVLAVPSYRLRLIVAEDGATFQGMPSVSAPIAGDETLAVYCGCPDDCSCEECPSCVAHTAPTPNYYTPEEDVGPLVEPGLEPIEDAEPSE